MTLRDYALNEFKTCGWIDSNGKYTDSMQKGICEHVLAIVDLFSLEGHSGFSASYTISLLTKLLDYKPLSPLTGNDEEWVDHDYILQNKRCSSVFKNKQTGRTYHMDAIVFYDVNEDSEKSYFTSKDSSVDITFPYTVPDKPEYRLSEE